MVFLAVWLTAASKLAVPVAALEAENRNHGVLGVVTEAALRNRIRKPFSTESALSGESVSTPAVPEMIGVFGSAEIDPVIAGGMSAKNSSLAAAEVLLGAVITKAAPLSLPRARVCVARMDDDTDCENLRS
jgi:hypothetical protein